MGGPKMTETVKQIHYLAAALKAPRITEAATRLADQARDAGWSFEDYLAAILEREVSARNASGAELRIRAAGSRPARRSRTSTGTPSRLSVSRSRSSRRADSCWKRATSCCWARPARARPTWPPRWGSSPPAPGTACC